MLMLDHRISKVGPIKHAYDTEPNFYKKKWKEEHRLKSFLFIIESLALPSFWILLDWNPYLSFFLSTFLSIIPHASRAFSTACRKSSIEDPATALFNVPNADLYCASTGKRRCNENNIIEWYQMYHFSFFLYENPYRSPVLFSNVVLVSNLCLYSLGLTQQRRRRKCHCKYQFHAFLRGISLVATVIQEIVGEALSHTIECWLLLH